MKNEYSNVSCSMHSELELIIMHDEKLELSIRNDNYQEKIVIKPYDLVTRKDKGEYLLGKGEDEKLVEIRLDQISKFKKV
jgi:transcriptional antiterminator Rof (Rho-off)